MLALFFGSLVFDAMSAGKGDDPDVRAVVTTLPAHSKFYRARIATKDSEIAEFRTETLEKLVLRQKIVQRTTE